MSIDLIITTKRHMYHCYDRLGEGIYALITASINLEEPVLEKAFKITDVTFKSSDVDFLNSQGCSLNTWKETASKIDFEEFIELIKDEDIGLLLYKKYIN